MLDAWPIENTRRYYLTRIDSYRRRCVESLAQDRERRAERTSGRRPRAVDGVRPVPVEAGPTNCWRRFGSAAGVLESGVFAPASTQTRRTSSASFDEAYKRYYWPGPDFVPNTVDIVISLFRIRDQPMWRINDPACGWRTRTTAGVDIHTITSDHFSLLREPHVRTLAQMVAACLDQSAGSGKRS